MKNEYAILELGAISDSILFKQMMNSRHNGFDITPKSTIPGTLRNGVSYFSKLASRSYDSKGMVFWLRQFVRLSPEILYLSSHHINLPPTPITPKPSHGTKFYSANSLVFEFIKDGLQCYSMVLDEKYDDARVTVNGSKLGDRLVLLIMDGCNMHGPVISSSAAIQMQNLLSSKTGKPIVLGFNGVSRSTAQLYKLFLQSIPAGTDFSKTFARKTKDQNKLIKYWIEAGKTWGSPQKSIMSAVDNNGKIYDNMGNLLK